ncbi:hypothetical protein FRC03_004045 [Tulasnella sp. 419]|nr:hypothetical protein FRC03_004045 [Tulasnella sp. 419]
MSRLSSLALAALIALGNVQAQQTGGSFCITSLCVNALVEGDSVTYRLKSTMGFNDLGWMAIGFGNGMIGSPMVITWPNQDGTITISQRQATAHAMPQVVPNPPQVATLAWQNSILATNDTTIVFSMPVPESPLNAVNMIYAYSGTRPSSSPDAVLQKHLQSGTFVMDLTRPQATLPTGSCTPNSYVPTRTYSRSATPTSSPGQSQSQFYDPPLTSDERKLVTHGILMSLAFLVLLPIGALIPRYTRTVPALQNKWFTAHWIVQFLISSPLIFAGWALAYQHVGKSGRKHFEDPHQKAGLALLVLYLVQIVFGAIIHFFKPGAKPLASKSAEDKDADSTSKTHTGMSSSQAIKSSVLARPVQNYLHAIAGLSIIGLAFWNVRYGIKHEWTTYTGRSWTSDLNRANKWWLAWVIIVPILYALGLALLPRQWHQEAARRSGGVPSGSSGTNLVKINSQNPHTRESTEVKGV